MLKITAYSDKISVAPGDELQVMVNCEHPQYQAELVRIRCGDDNPDGPGVKMDPIATDLPEHFTGRTQTIYAGSYGQVEPFPSLTASEDFSLSCWIMPTTPGKGEQTIMGQYNAANQAGYALIVDEQGSLGLRVGDGTNIEVVSTGKAFVPWEWYFVAATYQRATGNLQLTQIPLTNYATVDDEGHTEAQLQLHPQAEASTPIMFAAHANGKRKQQWAAAGFYNGKIAAPTLCQHALSLEQLRTIDSGQANTQLRQSILGKWDFSQFMTTDRFADGSAYLQHGSLINAPTRAVPGPRWDGEHHDWKQNPSLWDAVHFHDDDLYDAQWDVDFTLKVPETLSSGLYAVRLSAGADSEYVPFAVRPKPGKEAKICFLLPTASYMAYANEHFTTNPWGGELMWYRSTVLNPDHLFLNEHREYGHSCYDRHSDNSPVYYSSRLRPILNMRPMQQGILGGFGSSLWQFNADTHIIDWMSAEGFEFDVITDEDLHQQGLAALKPYNVVVSGSHPEYYTKDMWDGLYEFTQQGGRLMYLGANGYYWRCGYDQHRPGLLEIRRAEDGSRASEPPTGEYYLSTTGEYSGLWRRQGRRSPQVLTGVGFSAEGFDVSSYYRQTPDRDNPRVEWMFDGIGSEELLGDFGLIGGGAAGLELDRVDRNLGTPPHALVVASSEGHTDAYMLVAEELLFNLPACSGTQCDWVRADICFYETPHGGAVWSVGSIAYAGSLSHNGYDNNIARLTGNVLRRFADGTPFPLP